jgi:hypothetical protein
MLNTDILANGTGIEVNPDKIGSNEKPVTAANFSTPVACPPKKIKK